jgi:hypothetical protein
LIVILSNAKDLIPNWMRLLAALGMTVNLMCPWFFILVVPAKSEAGVSQSAALRLPNAKAMQGFGGDL